MTKTLPDLPVVGLGCMNLSHAYGHSPSREQAGIEDTHQYQSNFCMNGLETTYTI
jgi:hypothetical protein